MKRSTLFLAFALALAGPAPTLVPQEAPAQPAPAPAESPAPELTPEQVESRSLAQQAIAWFGKGEWKRAEELAARAEKLDPRHELAIRVQGWCAVAIGEDARAADLLTRALNLNPADGELQLLLAGCHVRLEEWGAAKDLLSDLLKRNGPSVPLLSTLAECCTGEGDAPGALALLGKARELAPKDRELVLAIVGVHEKFEDWAAAAKELVPLVAAAPGEAPLRWRLIHRRLSGEDYPAAISDLEEACRTWGDDPRPHELLAELYGSRVKDPARQAHHQEWLKAWKLRRR
jgi:tetratricopeptide (TPR) repeat protein